MTRSSPASRACSAARFLLIPAACSLLCSAVVPVASAAGDANENSAANGTTVSAQDKSAASENLQGQTPYARFAQTRFDFGDIFRGQKVSYAFDLQNSGSGTLQIRSIHSSCGCINTRVEPKDIFLPGNKGKIAFDFDSSNFSGPVVRTLTIDTNQSQNSTLTLTFTANVREEIRSVPALLGVGEVLPEYNKAWLMQLPASLRASSQESESIPANAEKSGLPSAALKELKDTGDVRPVYVTSSHPAIAAEIVPPPAKGKDYALKVTFKGGLPIGPLREKVTVWNNSRYLKELIVPIYGEVVGHVKQSAKHIEFGVVTRPEKVRRTLTLSSDRADFVVESVTAELRKTDPLDGVTIADILKYSTTRTAAGTSVNFELRYPDQLSAIFNPVNTSGFFIVKTNDPDYREVKIPFFGVLRQESKR